MINDFEFDILKTTIALILKFIYLRISPTEILRIKRKDFESQL